MTSKPIRPTTTPIPRDSVLRLTVAVVVLLLGSSGSLAQVVYPPPPPAAGPPAAQQSDQQPEQLEKTPGVSRSGELYRARLAGIEAFHEVVDILRAELFHRGWTEQDEVDVDIMLRDEGLLVHHKLISVFDPERFATRISRDPGVTLLSAQQILVYQERPERSQSYRAEPGEIVIALPDPAVRARALGLDDDSAAETLREDLIAAIAATDRFFRGQESQPELAPDAARNAGAGAQLQ